VSDKAIATAVQRSTGVHVYDSKGNTIRVIPSGGTLVGFTGTTVSVKRSTGTHIYDVNGNTLSVIPN